MFQRIGPHVSNNHHFKELLIHTQDLVTTLPQQDTLADLGPHLQVSETKALTEVTEEVHHPKLHQNISNFLTERVLGLSNVNVDIP